MNVRKKFDFINLLHCFAYALIIINLFLMNLNVLIGKPVYFWSNISLSLMAILLGGVVLYMRKGVDSTPLIGMIINVYALFIAVGTLFFYKN